MRNHISALIISGAFATGAAAAPLHVASYDMQNGEEYTSFGGWEYFDETYSGSGDTTTARAALSGGTGDLTDGVIGTATWQPKVFGMTDAEKAAIQADMRPYVGWYVQESKGAPYEVAIKFNFDSTVIANSVTIHGLMGNLNRSSNNEPTMPDYFRLTNGDTTVTLDMSGTPHATRTYAETIDLGGMEGDSLTLSMGFDFDPSDWFSGRDFIFVSEVQFDGVAAVPVPASLPLALAGLGALGLIRRKRA